MSSKTEARFVYASFKTYERAESYLEWMFNADQVTEGERPLIEKRKDHRGRVVAYDITLPM